MLARLILRYPLETTSAVGVALWLLWLVAPWNPWDISTATARAMDATGIPRPGWLLWVGLIAACKWAGILSGAYWPRTIGAALGFSFWIFLVVVIVRSSPANILIVPFLTSAIGSMLIFWSLQYQRGIRLRADQIQAEREPDAERPAA